MPNTRSMDWIIRGGLLALALVLVSLSSGCASRSQMTDVWRDSTLQDNSIHNVLVVAIRKDAVRRRAWEDAFVSALTERGVTATASYRLYAGAPPDTQEVIDAIREHHYDGVLTSVRLADESTTRYVPGTYHNEPVSRLDYYGRFHSRWITVQEPGYTETDTIIQVQTDLWSTRRGDGHLVWSGTLRTLEAPSGGTVEKAVRQHIMPELDKQAVFPAKTK